MLKMLKTKKLTILLLVTVFVLTGLGSAYGFVACEHGCFSHIHQENHHPDTEADGSAPVPFYPLPEKSEDTCRDTLIELDDGVFGEKVTAKSVPDIPLPPISASQIVITGSDYTRNHLVKITPDNIPQKLLVQRTIVLLI